MNENLLELGLRLLILQHGRQKVLHALAKLGEQTPEELELQFRASEEKRRRKRPKPLIMDLVASESRERPEIAELLRLLALGFQNRTFLPNLRDVQRFLDRRSSNHGKMKSREGAIPVLFRTLGKLPPDELLRLIPSYDTAGESDLSLLAREIMKIPAKERHDGAVDPCDKPSKS